MRTVGVNSSLDVESVSLPGISVISCLRLSTSSFNLGGWNSAFLCWAINMVGEGGWVELGVPVLGCV